ncbi:hypothetical protein OIU78_017728 [Salix suchowensis]|nr:hypothetical protein OIU78_017728 [Salix suchowensis]
MIHRISATFQQDAHLIEALLDMYSVNEDVFKFENFSLYLGLEDVLYITGLPIDGEPVTGIDTIDGDEECNKFLGISDCINHENKIRNSVKLSWLKRFFEQVPGEIDEDSPNFVYYVRAYALFLIGTIILPDASGHAVQTHYLQLLEKIEDIGKYAWGAALLAHLKCGVKKYKESNICSLTGNSLVLQLFAFMRFSSLTRVVNTPIEHEVPLIVDWTITLQKSSRNKNAKKSSAYYSELLNEVQEYEVIWKPYEGIKLPSYLENQLVIAMCKTILICFNECFAHQPDSCPKQFGLTEVRSNLIESPKIKSKRRSAGTKGRNWEDGIFSSYIQLWRCRKEHFIGNPSHPLHPMRSPPPASSSSPHVSLGGAMRSPPPPASSSSPHVSQGGAMRSPPPPASPPPASSSSPHVSQGGAMRSPPPPASPPPASSSSLLLSTNNMQC